MMLQFLLGRTLGQCQGPQIERSPFGDQSFGKTRVKQHSSYSIGSKTGPMAIKV